MRALLVLALFLTATFAGCLGGGGTMTAKEGLDEATKAAKKWSDDPKLVEVMSFEPFKRMFEEGEGEILLHLDSSPGDGSAPAWVYLYQGVDRLVFVASAAKLGVLAEGWISADDWWYDEDALPIEGWKIDSDEAADILSKEDDWPEMGEDMSLYWDLHMEDGEPYWLVEAENMTASWDAIIHAGNGTVMEMSEHVWEEWDEWHDESKWDSATLTALEPSLSLSVTLGGTGDLIVFTDNGATLGSVSTTLAGPDGFLIELDDYTPYETWTDLPAGTYVLTAEIESQTTIGSAWLEIQGYWYT